MEPPASEWRDDEPASVEGGVRSSVAVAAESDEAVEVKVRTPLGALAHMVHLQPAAQATILTDPAGPGQDLRANVLVLLQARGGAAQR